MEPRVQYARTDDGVDIAFAAYGQGPPLIIAPNLAATHVQLRLTISNNRSFFERLSRRLQVIEYDPRGLGMSQRDRVDFSLEAAERDLVAVADKLGLERFALYCHILAGDGPMAFAAHHPDRVTSVVWWVGQAITSRLGAQLSAIDALADQDWDLFTRILGRLVFGWDAPDATPYAELLRAGSSPDALRLARNAFREAEPDRWTARVQAPALVAHLANVQDLADRARALASRIPAAHVIAIPGHPTSLLPYVNDNEVFIAAVADFVEAAWTHPQAAIPAPVLDLAAMRAILWTDIEAHTALMQRLGDAAGRAVLREHEQLTRQALDANGGTEVKAMGDGFMAWFPSAHRALDCAVALQRAFERRNGAAREPVRVRVGVNAGEPIVEEDDLFGASVIAAARICREAAGGQIIVSDVVRQLVAGKGFAFAPHGETPLKGFDEPVRLYEVRWRPDAP